MPTPQRRVSLGHIGSNFRSVPQVSGQKFGHTRTENGETSLVALPRAMLGAGDVIQYKTRTSVRRGRGFHPMELANRARWRLAKNGQMMAGVIADAARESRKLFGVD